MESLLLLYYARIYRLRAFEKKTNKQSEGVSRQISDQNDYDRPEVSNARYHYFESKFRRLNHSATISYDMLSMLDIIPNKTGSYIL